jgi:addiction module RelE/StbE family toxin
MESEYSVIFSPDAEEQIHSAYQYVLSVSDNIKTAEKFSEEIKNNIQRVKRFPDMFPMSIMEGIRKINVGKFLMFYKICEAQKEIHILKIFHGAQDYINLF